MGRGSNSKGNPHHGDRIAKSSSKDAAWRRGEEWTASKTKSTMTLTTEKRAKKVGSKPGVGRGRDGRRMDDSDVDRKSLMGKNGRSRRDRDRLFRHRLLLPVDFEKASSLPLVDADIGGNVDVDIRGNADVDFGGNADVDTVWQNGNGGSLPPSPHRMIQGEGKKKRRRVEGEGLGRTTTPTTVANDEHCSLWEYGDNGDVMDEDSIEVVVVDDDNTDADSLGSDGDDNGDERRGGYRRQRLKIQSRCLPYSKDELLFLGHRHKVSDFSDGDDAAVSSAAVAGGVAERSSEMRSLDFLRGRIEAADALVQTKAPSYIEFQARVWHPELLSASPGVVKENDGVKAHVEGVPSTMSTAAIDYRSHRTFVAIAPRSKPHASSASAGEFIAALQSAAVEASFSDAGRRNPRPLDAVMEFLAIVAESRERPQTSPFQLMKKVWTLIASVASRCKDGEKLGNCLAEKFDVFLPDGYSMASSNLLVLEGNLKACTATTDFNGDKDLIEGCARTEEEFKGRQKTDAE
ncbi:hypothetical protein ACHAW5_010488 [Stephanodiscus triporus]|uniref:Uncharacterized protein n=1 Tax=Stephanodiscus triporus TaxID=2934178 RepID=A0ABD3QXY3_9STRA